MAGDDLITAAVLLRAHCDWGMDAIEHDEFCGFAHLLVIHHIEWIIAIGME